MSPSKPPHAPSVPCRLLLPVSCIPAQRPAVPKEPPACSVCPTGSRVRHCPADTHCGGPWEGCPDPRPGCRPRRLGGLPSLRDCPRVHTPGRVWVCARAWSAGSTLGTCHLKRTSRQGRQSGWRCCRRAVNTLLLSASQPVSSRSRGRRLTARQRVPHADFRSSRSLPRSPRLWGPPVEERSPETLLLGHLILSGRDCFQTGVSMTIAVDRKL